MSDAVISVVITGRRCYQPISTVEPGPGYRISESCASPFRRALGIEQDICRLRLCMLLHFGVGKYKGFNRGVIHGATKEQDMKSARAKYSQMKPPWAKFLKVLLTPKMRRFSNCRSLHLPTFTKKVPKPTANIIPRNVLQLYPHVPIALKATSHGNTIRDRVSGPPDQ